MTLGFHTRKYNITKHPVYPRCTSLRCYIWTQMIMHKKRSREALRDVKVQQRSFFTQTSDMSVTTNCGFTVS